ncbi:hypothetical protein CGLO_14252 [Colletotrichum gloeosporioides Cg-14]|uniref:Uncharacterized protein n=1 Tax=Colletotrichum gloeosporioides (strain Cg-14) TaxID=1237896 RepID=T0JUP1_COLGC|nr:hypothetical protein CGLO_14252 [Colletotrichum gloeosporioides Cg-14]
MGCSRRKLTIPLWNLLLWTKLGS